MSGRDVRKNAELTAGANPARRKGALSALAQHRHIYIILLPTLLFYLIFCYAPMFGAVIAFQKYSVTKGILGSKFVGLDNFIDFLTNYKFWQLIKNTLSINLYGLLFGFPALTVSKTLKKPPLRT